MELSADPTIRGLTEYGIQTETSTHRAHVCVATRRVYLYATTAAVRLIQTGRYPKRPTWVNGTITAQGYLVPPRDIPGIVEVRVPNSLWRTYKIAPGDSTFTKGEKAEALVADLIRRGLLSIPAAPLEAVPVKDRKGQLAGHDLRLVVSLQVKLDYRGGPKDAGGSGNLYLQTAERYAPGMRRPQHALPAGGTKHNG